MLQASDLGSVSLTLGKPTTGDNRNAYDSAYELLKNAQMKPSLYEESESEEFEHDIARLMA
jgi:hypothetical protein